METDCNAIPSEKEIGMLSELGFLFQFKDVKANRILLRVTDKCKEYKADKGIYEAWQLVVLDIMRVDFCLKTKEFYFHLNPDVKPVLSDERN